MECLTHHQPSGYPLHRLGYSNCASHMLSWWELVLVPSAKDVPNNWMTKSSCSHQFCILTKMRKPRKYEFHQIHESSGVDLVHKNGYAASTTKALCYFCHVLLKVTWYNHRFEILGNFHSYDHDILNIYAVVLIPITVFAALHAAKFSGRVMDVSIMYL